MLELTELGGIASERAALDRRERDLIDRARRHGATWAQIAEALGLASRQAAEQRRQRLSAAAQRAATTDDPLYGDRMVRLRAAIGVLDRRIAADPLWDTRFTRAELVRGTVHAAVEAPPGALFALARAAAADLADATAGRSAHPWPDGADRTGRAPRPWPGAGDSGSRTLRAAVDDLLRAVRASVAPDGPDSVPTPPASDRAAPG